MTTLGGYGRLGNQLFQYAMIKSVSCKLGYELKIPNPRKISFQGQDCLLSNFTLSCSFLSDDDFEKIQNTFTEKDVSSFDDSVFSVDDNTNFFGIYLNKKYFLDFSETIKKELNFIPEVEDYAKKYIENLRKQIDKDTEIVSVHMRRGDNTDGTNPTMINYYGNNDVLSENSIFGDYFYKSKKLFENKKVIYLIFTGGSRLSDNNSEDVNWCKNNLKGDLYFYSENNSSIQDFAIMSMCDHNIIGHETTFSWWAAFLNKNKNKIVVAPKKWFFTQDSRNVEGFYPEEFKVV
jgi:hypothetical protein